MQGVTRWAVQNLPCLYTCCSLVIFLLLLLLYELLNPVIFIIMRVARCHKKENNILTLLCLGSLVLLTADRDKEWVAVRGRLVWISHLMCHRKYWKSVALMRHQEIKFL